MGRKKKRGEPNNISKNTPLRKRHLLVHKNRSNKEMVLYIISATLFLFLVLRTIYRLSLHPLRALPGPIPARLSRIPLLLSALSGSQHLQHIALHARHGAIVRIGPNHIILSSPSHGPAYYTWRKADWWLCFRPSEDALAFSTELGIT